MHQMRSCSIDSMPKQSAQSREMENIHLKIANDAYYRCNRSIPNLSICIHVSKNSSQFNEVAHWQIHDFSDRRSGYIMCHTSDPDAEHT